MCATQRSVHLLTQCSMELQCSNAILELQCSNPSTQMLQCHPGTAMLQSINCNAPMPSTAMLQCHQLQCSNTILELQCSNTILELQCSNPSTAMLQYDPGTAMLQYDPGTAMLQSINCNAPIRSWNCMMLQYHPATVHLTIASYTQGSSSCPGQDHNWLFDTLSYPACPNFSTHLPINPTVSCFIEMSQPTHHTIPLSKFTTHYSSIATTKLIRYL